MYLLKRSEFKTTEIELKAMEKPAISGRKVVWENDINIVPKTPNFLEISTTHGATTPKEL